MIISTKHKYIFIRHQKTASTSIAFALPDAQWYGNDNCYHDQKTWSKTVVKLTGKNYDGHHVPLYEIEQIRPDIDSKKYFKFSFTRNPFKRMVSLYFYLKNQNRFDYCFSDWVKFHVMGEKCHWLGAIDNTLDFAKGSDFIGKVENLQEDFSIVCNYIGISYQKLPHSNKTNHKHYVEYYDDETKAIIAEKYAKDIEYFGYEFGE